MPTQEEINEAKKYLDNNKYLSYGWVRELAILSEAYDEALSEIARRQAWLEQKEQQLSTVEELVGKQENQISSITNQWEGTIRELEQAEKRIAELEAQLASAYVLDPRYEYVKQPGAPDWMPPAVKCKVRDNGGINVERLIVSYSQKLRHYHDIQGVAWQTSEPIEKSPKWVPKDDEPVAHWFDEEAEYCVASWGHIRDVMTQGQARSTSKEVRIAHYSGQRDMRVEALAGEPRYEP